MDKSSFDYAAAKKIAEIEKEIRKINSWEMQGWSQNYTLAAAAASIDITNIPQYAGHLRIVFSARSTRAATTDVPIMTINGDAGNNYAYQRVSFTGAVVGAAEASGIAFVNIGLMAGNTATAGYFSVHDILIMDYASANKDKQILITNYCANAFAAGNRSTYFIGADWKTLAAVTRVTFTPNTGPNLAQYTRVTLYGLG